jgi:hypothetical protein
MRSGGPPDTAAVNPKPFAIQWCAAEIARVAFAGANHEFLMNELGPAIRGEFNDSGNSAMPNGFALTVEHLGYQGCLH